MSCVRQSPQCPPESNLEFCKMILCQNIGCRAVHWIQFTVTALPCCASTSTAVNCSLKYPMPYCVLESCTTARAPPNWSALLIEIFNDNILHCCTFEKCPMQYCTVDPTLIQSAELSLVFVDSGTVSLFALTSDLTNSQQSETRIKEL